MSKNILFITESLFKERTGASSAIDGKQIFPMIKVAQDIHIQGALGSTLYKRLQEGIDADDLTLAEKELIDDYITDALVWFTMSMLPVVMGYQLFSKGFLQKTAEESVTPSRADLELLESKYLSMGEYYKMRLITYLQEHYTSFNEYLNIQAGYDVIAPEMQAYSCPIYLGDSKKKQFINSSSAIVSLNVLNYTSAGNETSFVIGELVNRVVYVASRSGLTKLITQSATNDTGFIQINNGTITLPTGDVTIAGELFTFLYK
jgi:hypothetical protein